jgi:hypothetical protein
VVVDEVVMGQIMIVEQLNENSVIVNEGARAEWICESLDRHGIIVDAEGCVDVKLFPLDCFSVSRFFAEHSESELTIIDVDKRVFLTSRILLHLFASDVAVLLATNHLGECVLVGLQGIHHHPELPIIFLDYRDGSGRIITDDASHDRVLCLHVFRLSQVLEELCIVVELEIGLELLVAIDDLGLLLVL